MKKVVVTGVTGKSGIYFYLELCKNAYQLTDFEFYFVVRNQAKAEEMLQCTQLNQHLLIGSLNDKQFVNTIFAMEGIHTLLHIAGIDKSLPLVKAAVKASIKRLILVHTTGIYSKYKAAGETYRQIEKQIDALVNGRNMQLTYLRPTMIYGNLHDKNVAIFMTMVDRLRIFPVVNGAKYALQPVWCGDLGKAYYQVLLNPDTATKRNYNLSGGQPVLLLDMLKIMAKYLGVKNRFISVPFSIAYSLAWVLYIASFGKKDYREKVQRLVEPRTFDHNDAANDFGYAPLSFEIGVKAEVAEYLALHKRTSHLS